MWISLHVHSQYSLLDSTISPSGIAKRAKECGMKAVGLTDSGNFYGAIDFYKTCTSIGIQPIIGCEIKVATTSRKEKKISNKDFSIVLLARNEKGYKNLCKISSVGYLEGFYYHPRVDREIIEKYSEGLLCLSGGILGSVGKFALECSEDKFVEEVLWYQKIFGEHYYFELQRHQMREADIEKDRMRQEGWAFQKYLDYVRDQEIINQKLIEASKRFSIPCVATNDVHYKERDDWKGHEILLNIQSGEPCEMWEVDSLGNPKARVPNPKRRVYSSHEFYFKSPEEMKELFLDIPEAIQNSVLIAEKCHCVLDFSTKHYPVFVPLQMEGVEVSKEERQKGANEYLYRLCQEAISDRYTEKHLEKVKQRYPTEDPLQVVHKRLDYEFSIISTKGMCDYLLIVHDFISWAKKKGIFVGPGRGSAAGSILCYLLGITDIEPLRFHLFFERFINPERISYPDIDVDICMDRRSEVIEYTLQKYGRDKVAQIITFGTMKAKMAIKDVGRVLSVPLSKVNAIAKLIPEDFNITLEKALEMDPELKAFYEKDEEVRLVVDMAKKVEGSIRNTSTHAAGIIISASSLMEHVPLCTAKDSDMLVTQFSMKPIESVGMLKIDILGLKTLTSIQKAIENITESSGKKIDWISLPLDDKKTFQLLNQGKTLGVFQLESGGMQELIKQLHIDCIEEIIAIEALYRPGPMDMIPSFIQRKHGKESIDIEHPWMKEILAETYGVMVYQEQVMQIASKLADYSLGEGDVLRRAMGKKDKQEMEKQREKFTKGCNKNGISEEIAIKVFEKIERFASYGFNKSHAAAYAYLSYVTAYLKANYSHAWMAALMTCDRDDVSKIAKFIRECQAMNIAILPPDVNEAGLEFKPTKSGIRFAMTAIKGVGEGVVEAIIEERKSKGSFSSLEDFIRRIDKSRVGKRGIELLVEAGAFDYTGWSRDALKESVDSMYETFLREQKEEQQGIMNFFSMWEEKKSIEAPTPKKNSSTLELLQKEKELLGFYLTGHPMKSYQKVLDRLSIIPLKDFIRLDPGSVGRIAFVVEDVKTKIASKSQKKFAIVTISDGTEQFELPIWSEMYEEKGDLIQENRLLCAVVSIDKKEGEIKLSCSWLSDVTTVNDSSISSCDSAFDVAKGQSQRSTRTSKRSQEKKAALGKVEKPVSLLEIYLDIERVRLSHIVTIKKLFQEHSGMT
ncbi:MAG: DNA polymerase III subunit alpha, partial [Chlamydiota bacterium]